MSEPLHLTSRDNPLLKDLRSLSQDNAAYRKQGRVWLEGDHLCRAALQRGWTPSLAVFSESKWPVVSSEWSLHAPKNVVIPDRLFREISGLESPAAFGWVLDLPPAPALQTGLGTVVLDRVQDAGNVGSILRSAAAFGVSQVVAVVGTAALWSPKVLRAGMGAHFALSLVEGVAPEALSALAVPLVVTSSHRGDWVHEAPPPWPCAWVFGHEGQGVGPVVEGLARHAARIAQPGGEESLNVAAAAAICLHASATAVRR